VIARYGARVTSESVTVPAEESVTAAVTSAGSKRIAHGFAIQLACRVLGLLASTVSVSLTARYLGPDRYGQLTIAVVFIGTWASLADLGIGDVIVRRVTSGRGELEHLVRMNSGLSLVYSVPLVVLAVGSGLFVYRDAEVRTMLVVLSGQLLMLTLTARFDPVFVATIRFFAVAFSDVASRLATLVAVAWLVAVRADIVWFAVAQLIPPALQLLIQGAAASRSISLRPIFSWWETTDLLREALPVIGVVVLATVYWRCDGVVLSLVSSHAEVGVYALACTVALNTVIVSLFFQKATLSTATELFAGDVAEFARFMRRSVELMWFLAVPVAVIGGLLAGPLIGFFGDSAFVGRGTSALALLCVAAALRFVGTTLSQGLFACHQQGFLFRMSIAELGLIIGLNLALDGRFGAVGAGIAVVCTELSRMVIASWWLRRQCGYRPPVMFLLRLLAPTAASIVVALLVSDQHVLLRLTAAFAVYLAANMAVGPVTWSTFAALRRQRAVQ
jgi:O-antigen/teichoic acid export membrane protein